MTLRRLAIKLHPLPIRPLLSAAGWLALLLPVFAWAPLTYPGYFEFHSGFLPIFNLNDLARNLADSSLFSGQALAWAPTVGQSYDLWRGERALPYLLALLPRALGATPTAAVKWIFGASLVGGAVGIYGWARRRLGAWPGLVAAFVYALWPIGLATVYVRGAFAEAVFLGLMPWVLWAAAAAGEVLSGTPRGLRGEVEGGRRWATLALALTLAAASWTQAGLALWLAAIVLIYQLSILGEKRRASWQLALYPWLGWLGGLVLGGLGLLPVILRHGLGGGAWPVFADHFVYPHQLLQAGWGTGPSIAGPSDTLTFQLGLVACGLGILGIGYWISGKQYPISNIQYLATTIVLSLSFLSTTLAAPLWRVLPFLARTLTYPWQLLLLAGPWLAWLAGLGARRLLDLVPRVTLRRMKTSPPCPPLLPGEGETAAPPPSQGGGRGVGRRFSGQDAVARKGGWGARLSLIATLLVLVLLGSYDSLQPKTTNVPVPAAPVAIFGDNEIALLSAVTAGPPGPGGRVTALVRWQALRPLDHDYTVFFHAIGPDGNRWGQQDTMPQGNQLPTSQWRPGQVVADQYQVILAPGAPISSDYRYLLGLYLWQTGQRLATGPDDKVVLGP